MIQNWIKYEAYREQLMQAVRKRFKSLGDDYFYDIFHEAYLKMFSVFEHKFDPKKGSNERGYLYELIKNEINDSLHRNHTFMDIQRVEDLPGPVDFEFGASDNSLTFAEFLFGIVVNKYPLEVMNDATRIVKKHYEITVPLIKMEAWSQKQAISAEDIKNLSSKIQSDSQSEEFYDWREPMPILRIKTWAGCS